MAAPVPELFDLVRGRPITPGPNLVESALEHRLGGQLLSIVESDGIQLSATDCRTLMVADLASADHHRHLWRAMTSAVEALAQSGISSIAIKGVAEEARWYGRVGERPCSDVDLVIAPDDVARIDEVLAALAPDHPAASDVITLVRRRQLQHVDITWDGVAMDIHLDPLKLGLWTRQVDLAVETATVVSGPDGQSVPVLAPELALVAFLTHLNKDRFSYLGAYGDVARIATRPELDWDLVDRFVRGEALQVPVWKSLSVVVDALDIDLDVPVVTGWRARLWDRLWPASVRLLGHEGRNARRRRQAWIPLLTSGRWPEVVREARRQLGPPKALLELDQPDLRRHGLVRRLTLDRVRRD